MSTKKSAKPGRNKMRKEHDFSQGERAKYARPSAQGAKVVGLDRQMAKDAAAGKLDFLIDEARTAVREESLRDWPKPKA